MSTIIFVDEVAYKSYSPEVLRTQALGGSEASVVRVAEWLAREHRVFVATPKRERVESFGATYVPLSWLPKAPQPDVVVVFRDTRVILRAKQLFPSARIFLWMEDLVPPLDSRTRQLSRNLLTAVSGIVYPSQFHRRQAMRQLVPEGLEHSAGPSLPRMEIIPNPIDDDLRDDGGAFDRNKLVYFSSPHKGGKQTLQAFAHLRRRLPEMKLYTAVPGYIQWGAPAQRVRDDAENVVNLGSVSHREIIEHVRRALCVFYPNTVYPETFGNVYAESNAVGTPVLAHDFGAAPEILGQGSQQLVRLKPSGDELCITQIHRHVPLDDDDLELLRSKVERWRAGGRPTVSLDEAFRLKAVGNRWRQVLEI